MRTKIRPSSIIIRFVCVYRLFVNSSCPVQVVIYTDWAKCVLMENGPNAHFDACFYDGEHPCILSQSTHTLAHFIQMNTSVLCTV